MYRKSSRAHARSVAVAVVEYILCPHCGRMIPRPRHNNQPSEFLIYAN